MNKDKLYVISFEESPIYYSKQQYVALFNNTVISEKEAREIISKGRFIYEHDNRLVVMTMEQYTNLCK